MNRNIIFLTLSCLAASVFTLCAKPIEIAVGDTGFEEIKDGRPVKFDVTGGQLLSTEEKRSGSYGGKFIMSKGVPLNALYIKWNLPTAVRYGDTYTISVWAKGEGKISYLVSAYSGGMWKHCIWGKRFDSLTDEWKLYSWKFKVGSRIINNVRPGFQLAGNGYAVLDDISMTYDPEDNNGRQLVKKAPLETILPFKFSFHDSVGTVKLNGKETQELKAGDGFNVLEVALRPTGQNPSFTLDLPAEYALCRQVWKEAPQGVSVDSSSVKFNDSAWTPVQPDKSGKFVPRNKKNPSLFRAVILWNRDYYAKESMLHRWQKEWLLPAGSIQLLTFEIGPNPLARTYGKSLQAELYLPDGVSLMDMKQKKPRYILNQEPQVKNCGSVKIGNEVLNKYLLTWDAKQLKKYPNNNQQPESRIPLRVSASIKPGKTASIQFGRVAPGCFAEALKKIPVRFFPQVNGKQPKKIMIQIYVGTPLSAYSSLPEEVLSGLIEQAGKVGVNSTIGGKYFSGYEYLTKCLNDAYDKAGVKRFIWTNNNFPLYSLYLRGIPSIYEQHKKMPSAQAKYFPTDATIQWGSNHATAAMYCPSYMLDVPEGRRFFLEILEKGLRHEVHSAHRPAGIFFDYEQSVWRSVGKIPGNGSHCFCERCRSQFQQKLSLAVMPDPQEIKEKYYKEWEVFRTGQDLRLNAAIHDVCKKIGMKMMYYTQTAMKPYYKSSKGAFDYLFLGHPSKYGINSSNQAEQDKFAAALKPDYQGMIAQVFPEPSKYGPGSAMDGNPDGFFVPSRWKSIILRLIATYRIGVDISSSTEFYGGVGYYIGEATRAIAELEEFFLHGKRSDDCAEIADMKYPDILGLELNGRKIILLFNEDVQPKTISVNLKDGCKASAFYSQIKNNRVVIPPENAEILLIEKQ